MTAALISRLVERHVLCWDAPLAKMLPALAATMRPEYRKVTLVELLSHRSGLPHDVGDLDYFSSFAKDKDPLPKQLLEYISHALKEKPVVPPGTALSYSNTGFIVAAVIAEKATGRSYEDLMRQEIFRPLGMKSPGFGRTPAGEPTGHHDGRPETASDGNPLMFAPAGNIYMSMADWARFCLDQMAGYHGHGKLLTEAGYRMMEALLPGAQSGMDWGVRPTFAGLNGPVLEHAGSDTNWFALALLFPESQNGVLVAANAADDMGADKAALRLVHMIAPSLAPPAEQAFSPGRGHDRDRAFYERMGLKLVSQGEHPRNGHPVLLLRMEDRLTPARLPTAYPILT
ncbi:MAG: serine hydrolase domain-containing protein [Caulobacteraceae bacterium]